MRIILFYILTSIFTVGLAQSSSLYEVNLDLIHNNSAGNKHEALQQVIDRITPGPNDHENPVINAANPDDYIVSTQRINGQRQIKFNADAIHQLMIKAGQQPWVRNHPTTLTWICRYDDPLLRCLHPDEHPELFTAVAQVAKAKGLTLVFPTDYIPAYRHSDGPFVMRIWKNVQSMKPEAVLYIKITGSIQEKDIYEWWELYYRNKFSGRNSYFKRPPSQIGKRSMSEMSQAMFEQGEEIKKESHPVDISISNIQTANDYYDVDAYLKNIPGVIKSTLNSVTLDAVLYTLDITIPTSLLKMRLAQKYTTRPSVAGVNISNYQLKI